MSDAHEESVESLDDQIAAEFAAAEGRQKPQEEPEEESVADAAEAEEPADEPAEEPTDESEEPAEEEKLQPYDHWREDYKQTFSSMNRSQQEAWLQREKEFDEGIRSKGQELSQAKRFVGEMHSIIQPVVNDWARQGLQPDAGIRRAIALEKSLRDNPQEAIIALARERGVDLQQTWAEQPYQDPQVSKLEKQLQEMRNQHEQWEAQQKEAQRHQFAQQQQAAYQQIMEMSSATDDSGSPKYPYIKDDIVMAKMAESLDQGRARSLESAYSQAIQDLQNHPFIKSKIAATTKQTVSQRQAEASRAKAASKAVDSNSTGTANQPKTLDQDIMEALEASGL